LPEILFFAVLCSAVVYFSCRFQVIIVPTELSWFNYYFQLVFLYYCYFLLVVIVTTVIVTLMRTTIRHCKAVRSLLVQFY